MPRPRGNDRRGAPAARLPVGARRPRLTIAVAVAALLGLALLGSRVDGQLKTTSLAVAGTESSQGTAMSLEHFGESAPFAILIEGPAPALDRQGRRLVSILRRGPKVTVISPWDRVDGVGALRPNRATAVVLVDFHVSADEAMATTVPRLEGLLEAQVGPPVRARAAGLPTIARAIREASLEVTRRGEVILAPILLIVLLIVFRSPVAAMIPLIFGAATVIAARGLITVVAGYIDISGFALSIGTMIGLAVGVDYALLIVSRFREELDRGADPVEAAALTRLTAGRTTVFAGGILLMAVLIAVCLVPGALLLSLCATVAPAIVVAVAGPWFAGPAILVLLGHNVNRWRIGREGPVRTRWLVASRAALRHPGAAAAVTGILLLAIAFPAASLATGPVTIEELSRNDPARLDVEAIEAAVGGGWVTPAVVVAVDDDGPITSHRQLAALDRWQDRVARQPGVDSVIGPGPLAREVAPLQRVGRRLLGEGEGSGGGMTANLRRASRGVARLRRGLGTASAGAERLALGSGRARFGADLVADGLTEAFVGGQRAGRALARFRHGSNLLAAGERGTALGALLLDLSGDELGYEVGKRALSEARRLQHGLAAGAAGLPATEAAAATTLERLETAWRELGAMEIGAGDPHYQALATALREALAAAGGRDPVDGAASAAGFEGLPQAVAGLGRAQRASLDEAQQLSERLERARESIVSLRKLSGRLRAAVFRLRDGSKKLAHGSDRIVSGASRISSGLGRLARGAGKLSDGLSRLRDGNARLARGLASSSERARPLSVGTRRAKARLLAARHRLDRSSPHIFDSGYFVLSALDGSRPSLRRLVSQEINLDGGGQAAKVLVIDSRRGGDGPDLGVATERLRASARRLAAATGLRVAVTGGVAQSIDYQRATSARLLPLVVAISLATFLLMLMILRALPLAVLAIALNLLAVAAAFGVLHLLTLLPASWPFGGASHIDPVSAAGIFGVVFGLSIDYAVFLLARMREGWERDADADAAIAYGLERTASVITGAATIMVLVFLVFATAPIQSVSQFGISLTVAVALDATVIRLMLVPALMKLIGGRIWWLPAWLDRHLPRLNVDAADLAAQQD